MAMLWAASDLDFDIVYDETDHPVATVVVTTPVGMLKFMAEVELDGRRLIATGVHAQGPGPHALGIQNLRLLAECVMERMDLDVLEIEGAVRTTGACPGRRPGVIRFARRVRIDSVS